MIFYALSENEILSALSEEKVVSWMGSFSERHFHELALPEHVSSIVDGFSKSAWYSALYFDDYLQDTLLKVGSCLPFVSSQQDDYREFLKSFEKKYPKSFHFLFLGVPQISKSLLSFGYIDYKDLDIFIENFPEEIFEGLPTLEESWYQEIRFSVIEAKKFHKNLIVSHLDYSL